MSKYDDIINLPHHQSETHPHMSPLDRAAQFAPFAALTGYEDTIKETARLTNERPQLDEQQLIKLNGKLLQALTKPKAQIRITYFAADEKKEGGRYLQAEGEIKKINDYTKSITLNSDDIIPLEDIVEISEL